MAITFRPLTGSYLDDNQLPELLKLFETFIGRPYDDASARHIPTIGIGLNRVQGAR